MSNVSIGIDNGVSGSIGIVSAEFAPYFSATPVFNAQDYTKTKKRINRVNANALRKIFEDYFHKNSITSLGNVRAVLERPMVNPGRWIATTSALRSLESTLVVLESLGLSYLYVDSKEWQKVMLPKGAEKEELKIASRDIGTRLFPMFADVIRKQKDADGLLIAEWARRASV